MDCQDGWFGLWLFNNGKSICKLVPKSGERAISLFKKNKSKSEERVKHISTLKKPPPILPLKIRLLSVAHSRAQNHKKKLKRFYLVSKFWDWVENLTALEYNKKRWKLHRYEETNYTVDENLFEMEDIISNQMINSLFFTKSI
jgi:hypothetical protein